MFKRNLILLTFFCIIGISAMFAQTETESAPVNIEGEYFDLGCEIFDKIYFKDLAVVPNIYWEKLVFDGGNLGEQYSALQTEAEKTEFQGKTIEDIANALYDTDDLDGYFDWAMYDGGAGEYILEASTLDFDIALTFYKENDVLQLIEAEIFPY